MTAPILRNLRANRGFFIKKILSFPGFQIAANILKFITLFTSMQTRPAPAVLVALIECKNMNFLHSKIVLSWNNQRNRIVIIGCGVFDTAGPSGVFTAAKGLELRAKGPF
jgi:hypothetical protein